MLPFGIARAARLAAAPCVAALLMTACHAPGRASATAVAHAAPSSTERPAEAYRMLADEMETHLATGILDNWYPRIVDKNHGGFGPHVNFDWSFQADNSKFLVFQSRMTWVPARVALRFPTRRDTYLAYAEHGLSFLENVMWDKQDGGFFWEVDESGQPVTTEKHVYGISFAIYASATTARATKSPRALALGMKAYDWLEKGAHDADHGGYYEALSRQGRPILQGPGSASKDHGDASRDQIGTKYGRKSMNSHIHLLESLTELFLAGGGERVQARLREVFVLVRDRIADQRGFLNLYFTPDWRPIADDDSYGHDVETAFLLLEAAEALGIPGDETTQRVARRLVDHALTRGWDETNGGFYDKGPPDGRPAGLQKIWWVQAEGLNGLLRMHELYGDQTDRYYLAFLQQWAFIRAHVIDKAHGEWIGTVGPAGELEDPHQEIGGRWKEAYHQSRALIEASARLRQLAARAAPRAPLRVTADIR